MKLDTVKQSNNSTVFNISRDVFDEAPASRQSFEQARRNVSHTAFRELFEDTANLANSLQDKKLFKGYLTLAIDGSTAELPKSTELQGFFGKSTPVEGRTYARISICSDVLNGFLADGEIAPYEIGERELAIRHVEKVTCANALFICDRGYWSPELVKKICDRGQKFLFRIPSNGLSAVTKSGVSNGHFTYHGHKLRFHNFQLKSGEMEYLVTNLDENEVSNEELEKLYALRWSVETRYNEIKNQVQMLRFMGKSKLIVKQDFYAYLTVMNLIAGAVYDAAEIVEEKNKGKDLKYEYKPNKTTAINILKTRYLRAAVEPDEEKKSRMFVRLIEDIARVTVPIRDGRHFVRLIYTGKHRYSG